MNRFACLHDLNNYFKIKDLLGGLSEPEKILLRKNIGIVEAIGDGGKLKPVDTSAATLLESVRAKRLVPGVRYRITDFLTIYRTDGILMGLSHLPSDKYTIIAIANSNSTLDPRVTIEEHKDWIVEFDITPVDLGDNIHSKGTITYLEDNQGNSAHYDFKNIRFKRGDLYYYTFSDIVDGDIIDSSELHNTKHNKIETDCYDNVFIGDTYNNILQPGCKNNTFYKGCHNSIIGWNSVNNVFNEAVRFTSGSIYNKTFKPGDTTMSTTITKTILKVNEVDLVSFLDPITYSYLVIII